jgi:hypothetical protein
MQLDSRVAQHQHFMKYTSNAEWPKTVSLGNTDNTSSDTHDTHEQAQAVCDWLNLKGFGGNGKVFPLRTWVGYQQ